MAKTAEIDVTATTTDAAAGGGGGIKGRRIVKATTPKADELIVTTTNGGGGKGGLAYAGPSTPNGLKTSNDDDDFVPIGGSSGTKSNKRDHLQDEEEKWRNDRLKTTEERGRKLREKQMKARRQQSPVNTNSSTVKTGAAAAPEANPFSRFLSAFSVESKFPEHKRSFEESPEDDEGQPSEKRLKPSSGTGEDPLDTSAGVDSLFNSKVFWITTAITVAVGVAFAVHRGRMK